MSARPSQQAVSAPHDIELTTSPEADSHGDRVPPSLAQDGMPQLQMFSVASGTANRDTGDVPKRFAQSNFRDLNHSLKGVDVSSLSFSPDSKYLATGGHDGFARVFDVGSGEEILMTLKHEGTVTSLCYSPNGKCFATVCDELRVEVHESGRISTHPYGGFARIFDAVSGKEIHKTKERLKEFRSVSFAPDCMRIATGCEKGGVRIFDVVNGEELMKIDESSPLDPSADPRGCHSVCFSPDGKCLARDSGDGFVRIVDASDGREMLKSKRFTYIYDAGRGYSFSCRECAHGQFSLCFSPDGKNLAIGSYHSEFGVRICSVASGQEIMKFVGISACFSPDGRSIATIDDGELSIGVARIFDLATGKEILKTVKLEQIELLTRIFDLATAKEILKL
jgi:WD40 repeat protein